MAIEDKPYAAWLEENLGSIFDESDCPVTSIAFCVKYANGIIGSGYWCANAEILYSFACALQKSALSKLVEEVLEEREEDEEIE